MSGTRHVEVVPLNQNSRKSFKMPLDRQSSITSVFDIYKQVRILAGSVANVWGLSSAMTCLFRQVLPGLARVRVGQEVFVVPGYLLQDLDGIVVGTTSQSSTHLTHTSVTDPTVQEVTLRYQTSYFRHVIVLLKLRWLLRLHSACCELDYKMCSLRNLIHGMQYVALQQHSEAEADSIFDSKVSQHIGSHLNLDSVLDDICDQLQRALGGSWRGFLEYVTTCDATRSVYISKMDSALTPPQVVSNDSLAVAVDTIFLANFLRQSRKGGANRLRALYKDLELLGMRLPEVPPLQGARRLRLWAKAQRRPSRHDREQVYKKENEKLAQLDAVLLAAAIELQLPEVFAAPEDVMEVTANSHVSAAFPQEGAPQPDSFGGIMGNSGPPAARVILADKPQLTPPLFEAALQCIHHHKVFPVGIRERLYGVLNEEYGLTQEQTYQLAVAATQNIDGKRLPESVLLDIVQKEKTRLREYEANTFKITSHLLVPPLVPAPLEKGKPAKYTMSPPGTKGAFASTFHGGVDMSRSLPDLHSSSFMSRDPFKVPMITGPLTMDPDLRKLRTTGFFIRMPPL